MVPWIVITRDLYFRRSSAVVLGDCDRSVTHYSEPFAGSDGISPVVRIDVFCGNAVSCLLTALGTTQGGRFTPFVSHRSVRLY